MPLRNPGGPSPVLAAAGPGDVNRAVPGGSDDAEFDTLVSRIRAMAGGAVSRA
jgi:hypothetical protein